jgi:hypothetical protein
VVDQEDGRLRRRGDCQDDDGALAYRQAHRFNSTPMRLNGA